MMPFGMIFADEWSGLFRPFVVALLAVIPIVALAMGVGLGIVGVAILRIFIPPKENRVQDNPDGRQATLRKWGWLAVWGCGGLGLGLVLARLFRGDGRGPMVTATWTEKELLAAALFIPLGVGAGLAAGVAWLRGRVLP
jgi:hypothetical protein